MNSYDFIIVGGGVSGLSLAYHLAHSPLNSSILVVEKDPQAVADHALSFWTDAPTPFDPVVSHIWDRLQFNSEDFQACFDLAPYSYNTLRSRDYRDYIHASLSTMPQVDCITGDVERIEDGMGYARVRFHGNAWIGRWVFDSRPPAPPDTRRVISLQQHFKGWQIETRQPAFDPRTATLFDLRLPQEGELRFLYLLPYSECRALVECVLLHAGGHDRLIRSYIENTLGISGYRVLSTEGGVTPLTTKSFPRRSGKSVMGIGIRGGRVKPSTGYAFTRIQRDSAAIVHSLIQNGHPFDVPADSRFYRWCDAILLDVMAQNGENAKPFITTLFKNNSIQRVFRFLDEKASPGENLALMASLPPRVYWRSMIRQLGIRKLDN